MVLENQIIKQTLEMEQNDNARQKKIDPAFVSGLRASGGSKKAVFNLQEYVYVERNGKEKEKRQSQQKEGGFKINIMNFHNEFNI